MVLNLKGDCLNVIIQGDSKRWTKYRTAIFPELSMIYIKFERGCSKVSNITATALI
jgi:hypothetical protein